MERVDHFRGTQLTGIQELEGSLEGRDAVIGCSGPTFASYNDEEIPEHVVRVAVNEGIRKFSEGPRPADYWVFSDTPIIREYRELYRPETRLLVMHEATQTFRRYLPPEVEAWTVNSMEKPQAYDNPYQFYSRGTVTIGAIEMLRFMGVRRFFVHGLDCFRTHRNYYYDNRKPIPVTERRLIEEERILFKGVPPGIRLFVTQKLRRMIVRLRTVLESGLWKDIEVFVVASPWSQAPLPKLTHEEAVALMAESSPPAAEAVVEPPEPEKHTSDAQERRIEKIKAEQKARKGAKKATKKTKKKSSTPKPKADPSSGEPAQEPQETSSDV